MKKSKEPKFEPNNLAEILQWLDKNTPQGDKDYFLEHDNAFFHHSTGRSMRNNWNFWDKNSKITQYFYSIQIFHPDDMSGIVLESFRRKLLGKPIDLLGQVKYYQDFWGKSGGTESKVIIEINKKTGQYKIIQGK